MALYVIKQRKFLGEAPKHIDESNLLDYFLYVFEFTWTAEAFQNKKENIKNYFEEKLNNLLKENKISKEVQWWALVLFALRDLTEHLRYYYAVETINMLLNKISNLTEKELEYYCNDINNALDDEMCDILAIRPVEIKNLSSDAMENDILLSFLINNKDEFVKIFKKHLIQRDIDMTYIKEFMIIEYKTLRKFSDFWNMYYEIFLGYFLSVSDYVDDYIRKNIHRDANIEQMLQQINTEQAIKKINLAFFIASIKNKPKIDVVNKATAELINQYLITKKDK